MRRNWLLAALGVVMVALLAWAWIDAGREPVHPIAVPIAVPPLPGANK